MIRENVRVVEEEWLVEAEPYTEIASIEHDGSHFTILGVEFEREDIKRLRTLLRSVVTEEDS